ncbi:MAG: hypothetical protein H0W68_03020 [Gemmatimonadaceae bacterium]|nr:hypothetical protein [Gemmatimonadaceae bacterium]
MALVVVVAVIGCSENQVTRVSTPALAPPGASFATSVTCDGAYNCALPNPYRCADPSDAGPNRVGHPSNLADCRFLVKAGSVLYDGLGTARGTITVADTKINYGQRKTLNGASVVYAFSTNTTQGAASGWVRVVDINESMTFMGTADATNPGQGDYTATWRMTGGPLPARTFYDGMVLHNDHRPCGHLPNHYMLRPGGVINTLYALPGEGGVSNDTYLVSGTGIFKRALGVSLHPIPVYEKDSPIGAAPFRYMDFMYGHVNGRYGWVAREAVTTDPANTIIIDSDNTQNDTTAGKVDIPAGWTVSSANNEYYGTGYAYNTTAATSDAATFWFYLPTAQTRTVDAWWTSSSNRSTTAPFIAYNASGTEVGRVSANQQVNGQQWNQLGTFAFTAGWNRVVLSRWTTTGFYVIADGVKIR